MAVATAANASGGNATLAAQPLFAEAFDAEKALANYNVTVDVVIAVGALGTLLVVLLFCYFCYVIVAECAYAVADACYDLCHSWACVWCCRTCRAKLCGSSNRPVRGVELGELGELGDLGDETESDDNGSEVRSQTFVSGAKDRVAV